MKKRVKLSVKDQGKLGKKLTIQGIDTNGAPYQFLTKVGVKAIGGGGANKAVRRSDFLELRREPMVADMKQLPETQKAEITFNF